jgi:hypothetical protein
VASRKPAAEESSGISMPQMAPIKGDGDIIARLNSLEQQLAYAQEDNKRLRQRLAEGDRRIELEQHKNHQLKSV